jgi:hypothetical protein
MKILHMILIVLCIFLHGCLEGGQVTSSDNQGGGGGGSGPTNITGVSSVVISDASGSPISLDASNLVENVNPSSLTIEFSEDVTERTVTAEGNITITCNLPNGSDFPQPEITVEASEVTSNTYVISMTDAYKYQLLVCTLAFSTAIEKSDGDSLLSEVGEYTFKVGCALSDDFNADTVSGSDACWKTDYETNSFASWADAVLANFMELDTVDSLLSFNLLSSVNTFFSLYKEITIPDNDTWAIEIYFEDAPDFTKKEEVIVLVLGDLSLEGTDSQTYGLLRAETNTCGAVSLNLGQQGFHAASCDEGGPFYIRLSKVDGEFYWQYKTASMPHFGAMPFADGTWQDFDLASGTQYLGLAGSSAEDGSLCYADIGYVKVLGAESDTQF